MAYKTNYRFGIDLKLEPNTYTMRHGFDAPIIVQTYCWQIIIYLFDTLHYLDAELSHFQFHISEGSTDADLKNGMITRYALTEFQCLEIDD